MATVMSVCPSVMGGRAHGSLTQCTGMSAVTLGEQAVVCLNLHVRGCGCCSMLPGTVSIHRAASSQHNPPLGGHRASSSQREASRIEETEKISLGKLSRIRGQGENGRRGGGRER